MFISVTKCSVHLFIVLSGALVPTRIKCVVATPRQDLGKDGCSANLMINCHCFLLSALKNGLYYHGLIYKSLSFCLFVPENHISLKLFLQLTHKTKFFFSLVLMKMRVGFCEFLSTAITQCDYIFTCNKHHLSFLQ